MENTLKIILKATVVCLLGSIPLSAQIPTEKEAKADGPCYYAAYKSYKECGNKYSCYMAYCAMVAKCDERNNP